MPLQALDRSAQAPPGQPDVMRIGFMPLVDSAPLVVADEIGLFRRHGVAAELSVCPSWAGLRDRVAFGALDGAQMLAPMPIAAALGLGGLRSNGVVTATTSRNGNTITLSHALCADLGDPATLPHGLPASLLAEALRRRRQRGLKPPVLAAVFAFSSHNYLLRHWLASGGIDPDEDVHLAVVPPPLVAAQLAEGAIDGFCSGEPWGSRAVDLDAGRIVLTTADIWPAHPEKMLVFSEAALNARPRGVVAATAAVIEAIRWLDDPGHREAAATMLHLRALPGVPREIVLRALSGRLVHARGEAPATAAELFFPGRFTAPDPMHGAWWFGQMQRWRHAAMDEPTPVARLWRPDLWRQAAALAGLANPSVPGFAAPLA